MMDALLVGGAKKMSECLHTIGIHIGFCVEERGNSMAIGSKLCFSFFIVLLPASGKKCTFADEAVVMQCSSSLIVEHLTRVASKQDNSTEEEERETEFAVDFAKIGRICDKFAGFSNCSEGSGVSRKCRAKSLPNLMPLWDFLCSKDFQKQAEDEESCYRAIQMDSGLQKCFDRNQVDLSQVRRNGGEQFCGSAQAQLECYKEFSHLEKCWQAVNLQRDFFTFLVHNYSQPDAEKERESCQFVPMEKLVENFKVVQKEKAIGGCDESGECRCIEGYSIENETKKCIDVDECSSGAHRCSQKCVNREGGYECGCDDWLYRLSPALNNRTCSRQNDSAPVWLVFAHGQSIWNVSEDGKFVELKVAGLEKTAMLDVDVKENTIYFVDNGKNVIQRVSVNGMAKPEVIQSYEVDGVEGIAVDYIGRNLYSARKSDIFVQSLSGKYRMRLYKNKLSTPRALLLHSESGTLYGSDWSSSAFIYRAAADGLYFEKIVTKDIVWPNGLAVDSYSKRIFWADAFLDTIQSMDLDGSNRRTVLANSGAVAHLFGLAVADDYLYWTDWNHRGILRANKLTGQNATLLAQTTLLPYAIKVFHVLAQPAVEDEKNPCHNKNCSHLCILTKNATEAICSCADGYSLSSKDGRSCRPDCKESSKNIIVCGGSEPKCVNKRYVCDGILHCPDRLDEQNCQRVCPLGQFQCLDDPKNCLVDATAICDGTKQCKDGSDERFCSQKKM